MHNTTAHAHSTITATSASAPATSWRLSASSPSDDAIECAAERDAVEERDTDE